MHGKKKKHLKTGVFIAVVLLAIVVGGIVYVNDYYRPLDIAMEALADNETLEIYQLQDAAWVFAPEERNGQEKGLIFYPGGKVAYEAYAPLLRMLAESGLVCVLPQMPVNLAVLDMDVAEAYPARFPQITEWYLGGHSLGGSMAAGYAADHAQEYEGLILLASYSAADLKDTGLRVLSIYGSEDKVLNMEKYTEYKGNLPEDFQEMVIEGGCHAYFGSYGPQEGDGTPAISNEEQLQVTTERMAEFIKH